MPDKRPSELTVLNVNGIHIVSVVYCGCHQNLPRYQQLLCSRWYPSSTEYPGTAATFELLKQCHLLSLQAKLSVWHYYLTLERLTDNTGLRNIPVRTNQQLPCIAA